MQKSFIDQTNWMIKSMRLSFKKISLCMKLCVLFLICSISLAYANDTYAQKTEFSITVTNQTVKSVLKEIENNSDFDFFFSNKYVDVDRIVSISVKNENVFKILDRLFAGTDVVYSVLDKKIILTKKGVSDQNKLASVFEIDQTKHPISGKVLDSNGDPIIGANVLEKGTTNGTITNIDGEYSLNIENNAILIVSYIGYTTNEIKIGNQKVVTIVLKEDAESLEEVVVVGYGTQKKVNLTGAINVIGEDVFKDREAATVSQMLQGSSPGFNFSISGENGFEPGASMNITIRGMGSLNGGSPYVVIDGFPGSLDELNPNDIESISVLKDAAASAIYGARAPYGVILVTTKKGKRNEKVHITYSGSVIYKTAQRLPKGLDSYTWARVINEAGNNQGGHPVSNETVDRIIAYQKGDIDFIKQSIPNYPEGAAVTGAYPEGDIWNHANLNFANTDWWDIYFGHSINQKHDISLQGGNERVNYYVSGGYMDDGSVINYGTDTFSRYNTFGKVNVALADWWDFGYESRLTKRTREKPNMTKEGDYSFMFRHIARNYPITPLYDGYGHYMFESHIPSMQAGTDKSDELDMWHTFRTEIRPMKGWKINADFAYEVNTIETAKAKKYIYVYDIHNKPFVDGVSVPNNLTRRKYINKYWASNVYSSYDLNINDVHNFTFLIGMQFEKNDNSWLQGYKTDMISDKVISFGTSTGNVVLTEALAHSATEGFFGRLNYNYKERYLFEANVRHDGSYVFRNGKRWGTFPSFSAGWNLYNEPFWKSIEPYVNTMKLRASWGQLGNQNVSPYSDIMLMPISSNKLNWIFGYGSSAPVGYTSAPSIVNNNLTWETASTTNIGIDLSFLSNRLTFTGDWYERRTTDMIGPSRALPGVLGANVPKENNSTLRTRGWEISVKWKHTLRNGLSYEVGASLYDDKSVVTKFYNPTGTLSTWYKGAEVGDIWGYTVYDLFRTKDELDSYLSQVDMSFIGSNWNTGDVKYEDTNHDGKVNNGKNTISDHGDLKVIGNSLPHYQYTFNVGVSYKGFDFSMLWKGVAKKDAYFTRYATPYWGFANGWWESCLTPDHMDYFRDEEGTKYSGLYEGKANINTSAFWPRPYLNSTQEAKNKNNPNTRYLANAAYLRLQNVQIGYNLPDKIITRLHLSKVRFYLSGENLLTITKLPHGIDPVAPVGWNIDGTGGNGRFTYGADRVYSMGLTVSY